jgi:myo-inositol-1(or 4)-monophosphatase
MTSEELDDRLAAADAVIRETAELAERHARRRGDLAVDRKGAQDLVSEADRACETLIVSRLERAFPQDGFLGEEASTRSTGRITS